jgi:hypothetical protein
VAGSGAPLAISHGTAERNAAYRSYAHFLAMPSKFFQRGLSEILLTIGNFILTIEINSNGHRR